MMLFCLALQTLALGLSALSMDRQSSRFRYKLAPAQRHVARVAAAVLGALSVVVAILAFGLGFGLIGAVMMACVSGALVIVGLALFEGLQSRRRPPGAKAL